MDIARLGHRLYSALNRRDWDEIGGLSSARLRVDVGSRPTMSFEQCRAVVGDFNRGFPDGHHVIEQALVSGDHFVTACRFEGTHNGAFAGVGPTGRSISIRGIHIDEFVDGKLVSHQGAMDLFGLFAQIDDTA